MNRNRALGTTKATWSWSATEGTDLGPVDRRSGGKWRELAGESVGFGGLKLGFWALVGGRELDWDLVWEMGYRGHGDGALYACHARISCFQWAYSSSPIFSLLSTGSSDF